MNALIRAFTHPRGCAWQKATLVSTNSRRRSRTPGQPGDRSHRAPPAGDRRSAIGDRRLPLDVQSQQGDCDAARPTRFADDGGHRASCALGLPAHRAEGGACKVNEDVAMAPDSCRAVSWAKNVLHISSSRGPPFRREPMLTSVRARQRAPKIYDDPGHGGRVAATVVLVWRRCGALGDRLFPPIHPRDQSRPSEKAASRSCCE